MSIYFTKLFASITESTIWVEPHPVRITWITMLAMADRKGRVFGSIPGLANRARVTVDECEDAINRFLSPDKYSRTPDNEGRRIVGIDGGWQLLNHAKYRAIQDDETIRETKRKWAEKHRESIKVDKIDNGRQPKIQAEAEAEAEAIKPKPAVASLPESISPETWELFKKHRGKKFTVNAQNLMLKQLEALQAEGQDPNKLMETSIANGWQGVFADKQKGKANGKGYVSPKTTERNRVIKGLTGYDADAIQGISTRID